ALAVLDQDPAGPVEGLIPRRVAGDNGTAFEAQLLEQRQKENRALLRGSPAPPQDEGRRPLTRGSLLQPNLADDPREGRGGTVERAHPGHFERLGRLSEQQA